MLCGKLLWRCLRLLPNNLPLYFPPPFSISFRSETHNTSPIAKKVLIPLQTTSEIGDVLHFGSAISVSTFTYIPSTTIIALVAVFQLNYIYCMNWSTTLVYYWCIYNIEWAAKWNGPISQLQWGNYIYTYSVIYPPFCTLLPHHHHPIPHSRYCRIVMCTNKIINGG